MPAGRSRLSLARASSYVPLVFTRVDPVRDVLESMAKLEGRNEGGMSLFPMFNILACTLGVMIFVLATVATVSLGADKAVEFVSEDPSDRMLGRTPMWMEWDGSHMTLLPSRDSVRFQRDLGTIPTVEETNEQIFEVVAGTDVGREISNASLDGDRFMIILVRPGGFSTLPDITAYLELLDIEVLAEPIPQDLRRLQVR